MLETATEKTSGPSSSYLFRLRAAELRAERAHAPAHRRTDLDLMADLYERLAAEAEVRDRQAKAAE
jgi:hypothetical protein